MSCIVPLFCALSMATSTVVFPLRTPDQILKRELVCATRMCCLYQATLRRLPDVLPEQSVALETMVLDTFLVDRVRIELSCPKVASAP
jgi:hypothetical protein